MQIPIKYAASACGAALLMGAALGYFESPTKTVVRTQTITQTRLVDHSHIVRLIDKKPNGETITRIERQSDITDQSQSNSSSEKIVERNKPSWVVSGVGAELLGPKGGGQLFGMRVERRIVGPLYLGAEGLMGAGAFGAISLGLQF